MSAGGRRPRPLADPRKGLGWRVWEPTLRRPSGSICWQVAGWGSGMRRFVGYLGGPQVGAEDFVADAVGGYAAGEQGGADVPHERQRPAGEDLNVCRQRDLGEGHETMVEAVVVGSEGFLPGVG